MRRLKKVISALLMIILVTGIIPEKSVQASIENINIISTTNITVEDAKKWAKDRNATDTFINLADLYWKYSSLCGNVNPAVAYVQAALETGYGKFGGVLDESYHNPCGLKVTVTEGDSDKDPNQHFRFNNWDEGVQAHLDHLALYAGAGGYPKANTYDPRHFAFIKGTAPTVKDLEGRWATSSNYASQIIKLYNTMLSYHKLKPIVCIDSPSSGKTISTNTISVSGWALNESGIEKVNVYIDNKLMGEATYGSSRKDVANIYSEYPNAENSGFNLEVDIRTISDGNRTIKVEQIGKDGTIEVNTREIIIKRDESLVAIETPKEAEKISGNSFVVSGWSLNYSGVEKINTYIDDVFVGEATYGLKRTDVYNAYPKYNNENSGYTATIDTTSLTGGNKTLRVEQVGLNGEKTSQVKKIYINKLEDKLALDEPINDATITGNVLKVSGWALTSSDVEYIKVYVDNKFVGNANYGLLRNDVYNVYPEYKNKNSGFSLNVDISSLYSGKKVVKVDLVNKNGNITSISKTINISRPNPIIALDEPSNNITVNGSQLKVSGWALNYSGVKDINIYIDDVFIGRATYGSDRSDVYKIYPEYNNKKSGYSASLDISKITGGKKIIKVEQVGNDGSKAAVSKTIHINKLEAMIALDTPNSSSNINGNSLEVSGWALSTNAIKDINIYIDNTLVSKADYGIQRNDVYNAFPNYNNKNSGYKKTIDISNISDGIKTLKVEQVDINGNKKSISVSIKVEKAKPIIALDEPANNEIINKNSINVSGWALNINKIQKINIYIDDVLVGTAKYGLPRNDVNNIYPQYGNKNSGYSSSIDISNLSGGKRIIKVEQVDVKGNKLSVSKSITINKPAPITNIEAPSENSYVKGKTLSLSGWALNFSGIKKINVYLDNQLMTNATYGLVRNDVYNVYKQYNNKNSGYEAQLDISKVSDGTKVIKVEQIGNDGSISIIERKIIIANNLPSKLCIDSPKLNSYVGSPTTIKVSGWALEDSGISKIMVYLDGMFVTTAKTGFKREDVNAAFPGYTNGANSGYEAVIDTSNISSGQHVIKVEVHGLNGKITSETRSFNYGIHKKLIVVDPGHNYGGDQGAFATHAGITYSETDLNMKIGAYVKGYLEDYGYNVIMTREASDKDTSALSESLQRRVDIANNSNADAFVSIHQNSFTNSTAHGVEVYYCNDGSSRVATSRSMAISTVNKIADSTSFYNRKEKTANFKVIKDTKMPAILVECGFISNPNEAVSLSTDIIQRKIAQSIADGIKENIK